MKLLHCVYSGLGGHGAVLFTLLRGGAFEGYENHVLFFGVEDLLGSYKSSCQELGISYSYIKKSRGIDFRSMNRCIKLIRNYQPNAVVVNGAALVPTIALSKIFSLHNSRS